MKLIINYILYILSWRLRLKDQRLKYWSIYVEHMPQELKKIKRDRWWPHKPYNSGDNYGIFSINRDYSG